MQTGLCWLGNMGSAKTTKMSGESVLIRAVLRQGRRLARDERGSGGESGGGHRPGRPRGCGGSDAHPGRVPRPQDTPGDQGQGEKTARAGDSHLKVFSLSGNFLQLESAAVQSFLELHTFSSAEPSVPFAG